jgi:hypothetical protein
MPCTSLIKSPGDWRAHVLSNLAKATQALTQKLMEESIAAQKQAREIEGA